MRRLVNSFDLSGENILADAPRKNNSLAKKLIMGGDANLVAQNISSFEGMDNDILIMLLSDDLPDNRKINKNEEIRAVVIKNLDKFKGIDNQMVMALINFAHAKQFFRMPTMKDELIIGIRQNTRGHLLEFVLILETLFPEFFGKESTTPDLGFISAIEGEDGSIKESYNKDYIRAIFSKLHCFDKVDQAGLIDELYRHNPTLLRENLCYIKNLCKEAAAKLIEFYISGEELTESDDVNTLERILSLCKKNPELLTNFDSVNLACLVCIIKSDLDLIKLLVEIEQDSSKKKKLQLIASFLEKTPEGESPTEYFCENFKQLPDINLPKSISAFLNNHGGAIFNALSEVKHGYTDILLPAYLYTDVSTEEAESDFISDIEYAAVEEIVAQSFAATADNSVQLAACDQLASIHLRAKRHQGRVNIDYQKCIQMMERAFQGRT